MRRVREKKTQIKVNEWYDARYPDTRTTLTLRGRKGWADEVYWVPGGKPILIEYKAEGEEPRKLQLYIHKQLREAGYEVQVHTSAAEAIAAIKKHIAANRRAMEAAALPARRRKVPT